MRQLLLAELQAVESKIYLTVDEVAMNKLCVRYMEIQRQLEGM